MSPFTVASTVLIAVVLFSAWALIIEPGHELRAWAREMNVVPRWFESRRSLQDRMYEAATMAKPPPGTRAFYQRLPGVADAGTVEPGVVLVRLRPWARRSTVRRLLVERAPVFVEHRVVGGLPW